MAKKLDFYFQVIEAFGKFMLYGLALTAIVCVPLYLMGAF